MLPLPRAGSTWASPNSATLHGRSPATGAHPAQEATQHEAAEDHLLDDRRGDDGGDEQRDDVRAVEVELADALGVADERDVQHLRRRPPRRSRSTIAASHTTGPQPRSLQRKRSPRSSERLPVAPATGGVPAPPHRRPVADDDGDRGVRRDRPVEPHEGVEQEAAGDERDDEHDDGADGDHDRQHAVGRRDSRAHAAATCGGSTAGRRSSARAGSRSGRRTSRPGARSAGATSRSVAVGA